MNYIRLQRILSGRYHNPAYCEKCKHYYPPHLMITTGVIRIDTYGPGDRCNKCGKLLRILEPEER